MNDSTPVPQTTECCGFPEMGVCPDCPDPETVEWGKHNPPRWIKTEDGAVLSLCGSLPEDISNDVPT